MDSRGIDTWSSFPPFDHEVPPIWLLIYQASKILSHLSTGLLQMGQLWSSGAHTQHAQRWRHGLNTTSFCPSRHTTHSLCSFTLSNSVFSSLLSSSSLNDGLPAIKFLLLAKFSWGGLGVGTLVGRFCTSGSCLLLWSSWRLLIRTCTLNCATKRIHPRTSPYIRVTITATPITTSTGKGCGNDSM